jgi:uncharacterized delta-60 repeat protein
MRKLFLSRRRASSLLPYGLIVGLVAVIAIAAVSGLGGAVSGMFSGTGDALDLGVGGSGSGSGPGSEEEEPDTAPDAFSFADVNTAEPGATVDSDAVALNGFDGTLDAVCGTGCIDIARNDVWAGASSLSGFAEGDTIAIRLVADAGFSTPATASVTVGDTTSANWTVTTRSEDTAPDAFLFLDQSDVNAGAVIDSNAVALNGFEGTLDAVCGTGCTDIARNNVWAGATSLSGFVEGDTIAIRQTSSSSYTTPTTAGVTVGDTTSDDWTVTTKVQDTVPNSFSFADSSGAGQGATVSSNAVVPDGYDGPLTATCNAGCTGISRNGGSFSAGPVSGFMPGETIAIQLTASGTYGGQATATVSLGGTSSATWTVTTTLGPSGDIDTSFSTSPGPDQYVITLTQLSSGKVLVGGDFNSLGGSTRPRLARLNSNGTVDTSFGGTSQASHVVRVAYELPDNKIIVTGDFITYSGTSRGHIARLNSNGTLDTTFLNTGAGAGNSAGQDIRAVDRQSDGKLVVGGFFTTYNGVSRPGIARIDADGALDTTFNPGTGVSSTVQALALQPGNQVVLAGDFTSYNGTARGYIARANSDGTLDTGFPPTGSGANGSIYTLAVQSDGKMIIGGAFTTYNGVSRGNIARLNTDGSLDTSFNPGTGGNSYIYAGQGGLQPDGKILIVGGFTSYNGTSISTKIARINTDGTLDTSFNPACGPNSAPYRAIVQPDSRVIFGGDFSTWCGSSRVRLARVYTGG